MAQQLKDQDYSHKVEDNSLPLATSEFLSSQQTIEYEDIKCWSCWMPTTKVVHFEIRCPSPISSF